MRYFEPSENLPIAFVCSLAMHGNAVPDVYAQEEQCGGLPVVPHLSQSEIQSAQLSDPSIREVITSIRTGESPSPTARSVLPRLPYLLREKDRLESCIMEFCTGEGTRLRGLLTNWFCQKSSTKMFLSSYMMTSVTWVLSVPWIWYEVGFIGPRWLQMLNTRLGHVEGA